MKLSTKSRYAVRSMINIALYAKEKPISIVNISDRENISERYLELIFAKLKKAGLIHSSRGSRGGYSLSKDAKDITIQDIVTVMEHGSSIVREQDISDPLKKILCEQIWIPIDDKLYTFLSNIKLSDLLN